MIKIINSREYRELCERVAFLEADINAKDQEIKEKDALLRLNDEKITRLKSDIVGLNDTNDLLQRDLDDSRAEYRVLFEEFKAFKAKTEKPQRIDFTKEDANPVEEKPKRRQSRKPKDTEKK